MGQASLATAGTATASLPVSAPLYLCLMMDRSFYAVLMVRARENLSFLALVCSTAQASTTRGSDKSFDTDDLLFLFVQERAFELLEYYVTSVR